MKVRTLRRFYDREANQIREPNTVFVCGKARGEYLIQRELVEESREPKEKPRPKKAEG